MKIAFFGTPRLAQTTLEKLVVSPYKPQLVVTALDTKFGRGQKVNQTPVKQTALQHKIEVIQNPSSIIQHQFDLAILVAYGKIIPKDILNIPKYGFINVHPSLLPKHRGPSPIQTAILAREEQTGVTIMKLDEIVDHGPILAQSQIKTEEDDTHASLIEKLGKIGANFLIETLPKYLDGSLKPIPQDHTKATFTKKITKKDGFIDLEKSPNQKKLDRLVRAYFPWPTVWTQLRTHNSKLITIKFLPGNLIQPEGKKPMTIKEFLNGYPDAKDSIAKLFTS